MCQCYIQLKVVVDQIPKGDIKILMSDFNVKASFAYSDYEHVMGRHGLGELSGSGELFAKFYGNNNVVIMGSLFAYRPVRKVSENQIDPKMETEPS